MLTYTFAKGSGESLYEQLYDRIKADILTGRLAAGEKLPSKRTLADHLELSVITVKNAYEQLIAEGYIYSRERSGYFVSAMDWPLSAAAAAPQKISQLPPRPTWFLDFASGSPEPDDFPFTVWSRLMPQTILRLGSLDHRSEHPRRRRRLDHRLICRIYDQEEKIWPFLLKT